MFIITGGAGFIGSNLVATCAQKGLDPIVVCDYFCKDHKWRNLSRCTLDNLISPVHLLGFLNRHKQDIQVIFHLGAVSSTTETDVQWILEQNYAFSRKLLDWCTTHQVRLIYASSGAVYGKGDQGFSDEERVQSQYTPLNAYAWSKLLFDRMLLHRKRKDDALPPQIVGLRFFNVYGPNESHKGPQRSVIPQIYELIAQGKPAKLFKSYHSEYPHGGQKRDFIWVEDCIDALIWFYEHPSESGIFNVGTGHARTFQEVAEVTFKALGISPQIEYIEMPEDLPQTYQYYTQAALEKLRRVGYTRSFTDLEEGVRRYVQEYLVQADPYR